MYIVKLSKSFISDKGTEQLIHIYSFSLLNLTAKFSKKGILVLINYSEFFSNDNGRLLSPVSPFI